MKNIGHQKTISFKENQYFEFTNQQVPNRLKMWKIGLRWFRIYLDVRDCGMMMVILVFQQKLKI